MSQSTPVESKPLRSERRDLVEIYALILRFCADDEKRIAEIVNVTHTNFKIMHKYLDTLVERGFLQVIREWKTAKLTIRTYQTTKKGLEYIRIYTKLRSLDW